MELESIGSKKSTTSKWLIGCGIGCGAILLAIILISISGYFFFKKVGQDFKETEDTRKVLIERYGEIKDFCPDPDGAIKPERLEAFLAVRRLMEPAAKEFEKDINLLSDKDDEGRAKEKPSPGFFTKVKTGLGIIPLMAEFIRSRNQALLEKEMGMGEYTYLYVVAFYSWLKKNPSDGPPFQIRDEEERKDERVRIIWRTPTETEEDSLDSILKQVHRRILPMLHSQYEKLVESAVPKTKEKWRRALAEEIKAMEADRFRLPWQDGLPEVLKASLEPFRERLEASYSRPMNRFEMILDSR